jgi:2-desacetyl-2-hydroxyethyl bacteriochlorophyllide A dehydrogenase
MERFALYFTAPRQVEILREELPEPGHNQVLVKSLFSAISPGTESLIYRSQFPADLTVDENIAALAGAFHYPLAYGYCLVGRVIEAGPGVNREWLGRLVFAFHPHASHVLAAVEELILVPPGISPENAVFLPNMETAINFVHDGAPLLGERAAVFGQGIVGLLTTALLERFPLAALVSVDLHPMRRQLSLQAGAHASFDPVEALSRQEVEKHFPNGADLVFEVSGAPQALEQAISLAGFAGRVVIGSWYGEKRVELNLGGRFHRSRIRLISSQVSSLTPELMARWTKERRFSVAWEMIRKIEPARWISHRCHLQQAQQAYQMLDEEPGEYLQILFEYSKQEE